MDIRIGSGFDFHRLEENSDRPLMVGGIEIPGDLAFIGHSDADLLLHALSDAIFGALGLGDIGTYFPDTDPANKNMDSRLILGAALARMEERNYKISNLDVTLIGEKPKLNPHRERILESLSLLLGVGKERIGLKATTTEKMGALGRTEGTGCHATILLVERSTGAG